MIGFFPEIYPDELLYSQLARYHARCGYARYVYTAADLYRNQTLVRPDVEFVNAFTDDAKKWLTKYLPWELLLEQHTMYPAYIRYLPLERKHAAVEALRRCEGNWRNLVAMPKTGQPRFLRYCPVCAEEDRRGLGETYWHRAHQVQRLRICPHHKCFLCDSEIPISSKASPGLYAAENHIPVNNAVLLCNDTTEIALSQYVLDVLHAPLTLDDTMPVGQYLLAKIPPCYRNHSNLVKNTAKLYSDYVAFYGPEMPTMAPAYMTKIFNGYLCDTFFVSQIAFFLGLTVTEITHLPPVAQPLWIEEMAQDVAQEFEIERHIVTAIIKRVIEQPALAPRVGQKSGPKDIRYGELDAQYLPHVQETVNQLLQCDGRPQKISRKKIERMLGLPQKQMSKLPRCSAYIQSQTETYPEFWARVVTWAVSELERTGQTISVTKINKITNIRIRDIVCCCRHISDPRIQKCVENCLQISSAT